MMRRSAATGTTELTVATEPDSKPDVLIERSPRCSSNSATQACSLEARLYGATGRNRNTMNFLESRFQTSGSNRSPHPASAATPPLPLLAGKHHASVWSPALIALYIRTASVGLCCDPGDAGRGRTQRRRFTFYPRNAPACPTVARVSSQVALRAALGGKGH